jgi:Ti-type conjugative transfer relaxase TraA
MQPRWACGAQKAHSVALYSASAMVISRSGGKSAVAAAAYRSASILHDERTGETHDYRQKMGVLHSEIVLPETAPAWAQERERLWNAAEIRETGHAKQGSATVAREFRIAMPHELPLETHVALSRAFAKALVDRYSVAVDFNIHAPSKEGDERNFHTHFLFTTREMTGEGLGKKTRVLDGLGTGPKEITALRKIWAELGAEALANAGFSAEGERFRDGYKTLAKQRDPALKRGDFEHADACDRTATVHMGPNVTAMERDGWKTDVGDVNRTISEDNASRAKLRDEAAQASAEIVRLDLERAKRQAEKEVRSEAQTLAPERIADALTSRKATFTRRDLDRGLAQALPDKEARSAFVDAVLTRADIIPLRENAAAPVTRYTSARVLEQEAQATGAARRLAGRQRRGVSGAAMARALEAHDYLDAEQRAALEHAAGATGFAMIAGEAGTGKSTTFAAIRAAYEADGYRVLGMAWTNAVVQDLAADGFRETSTIAAELFRQNSDRGRKWDRKTVLMVDEAAMLSTKHMAALLDAADRAGATVIVAGDDRQLASIEAGGLFAALRGEHGAAELHKVRRVKDGDQQAAFNAMHRGDFREALGVFDRRGDIQIEEDIDQARAALVAAYMADRRDAPEKSRFAFAQTNDDVDMLNRGIQEARRAAGELGKGRTLQTASGAQQFHIGDRVLFSATAKDQKQRKEGLHNGGGGVLIEIEEIFWRDADRVTIELDARKGEKPRQVSFIVGADAGKREFDALKLGYAGTIYKGQGKTLDRTFVLHTNGGAANSYVALTRHRERARIFAARRAAAWIEARGGVAGLDEKQLAGAEKSYTAWKEEKPEFAEKYGLASYVDYVQKQHAQDRTLAPLDRMAAQMGRCDETRVASSYIRADRPVRPEGTRDRPAPLSVIASVVVDFVKLATAIARDWRGAVRGELTRRGEARRNAAAGATKAARTVTQPAQPQRPPAGRPAPDPLARYRAAVERAEAEGIEVFVDVAKQRLAVAQEHHAAGKNLLHHTAVILEEGQKRALDCLRASQAAPERPAAVRISEQDRKRAEAHARDEVERFKDLAGKRRLGYLSYTDGGSKWSALPAETRERVKRFNAMTDVRQILELDKMRSDLADRYARDPQEITRSLQRRREQERGGRGR